MASFSNFKSTIVAAANEEAGVTTGVTVYATRNSLPISGNSQGDQAYVTGNNRLYIWNGSGWYNVALLNVAPAISSVTDSDGGVSPFSLSTEGTVTTITITAADSDGDPITYSATADSDFSGLATISQSENEFTITPFSQDSATTSSGTITFTATDGVNVASSGVQTFTLTFISQYWNDTVLNIGTWITSQGRLLDNSETKEVVNITGAGNIYELEWNADGTELFGLKNNTDYIVKWSLSTAYDVSTVQSPTAPTDVFATTNEETNPMSFRFGDSGSKMYVTGIVSDDIIEYDLSTAYDPSTASATGNVYDVATNHSENAPRGIEFNADGTILLVVGSANDTIYELELSTAWDISTATASGTTYSLSGNIVNPYGMRFNSDGTKLYIPNVRVITEFTLTTAYDISTMSESGRTFTILATEESNPNGILLTPDDSEMIIVGPDDDNFTILSIGSVVNNSSFIDRSTNASTVTTSGSPVQTAFHPYLDHWSVEFDGSGDYLTLSGTPTLLLPETSNTTFECWVNTTSSGDMAIFSNFASSSPYNGVEFGVNNGYQTFWSQGTWVNRPTGNTGVGTINDGKWHHLSWVITNSGTTLTTYVDGVQNYTSSITPSTTGNATQSIGSDSNSTRGRYFNGHITNLRFAKGTAVYTSAFTPPTENLTAISGTSFLGLQNNRFIDNSSNNHVLTVAGTSKISAFNPFGQGSEYAPGENKGSTFFNGSSGIVVDDESASGTIYPADSDWTLSQWIYVMGSTDNQVIFSWGASGIYAPMNLYADAVTGTFEIGLSQTGSSWLDNTGSHGSFNRYEWTHVEFSRSGGTVKLFINGTEVHSVSISGSLMTPTQDISIGARPSVQWPFYGYIADCQYILGEALHTTDFTPPTAPVTSNNSAMYIPHDNPGIYDKTGNHTLTLVGNAATSTTQTKFASTSIYFDGSDYISIPYTTPLATADFTIEMWVNITSTTDSYGRLIENGAYNTNDTWRINYNNTASSLSFQIGNTSTRPQIDTSTALTLGSWYHIAVCREGNTIRMFVNGTQEGGDLSYSGSLVAPTQTGYLYLGTGVTSSSSATLVNFYNGYLENVQILPGVAKYTANFTPPTQTQGKQYQAES